MRELFVTTLRSLGYSVLEAGTAKTALEIFERARSVDLLLTDVVLPGGMSGRQLSDEVRRRAPKLPVLYTSGYSDNALIHHGRLAPGVLLLPKPFRKADVARAVGKALKKGGA